MSPEGNQFELGGGYTPPYVLLLRVAYFELRLLVSAQVGGGGDPGLVVPTRDWPGRDVIG